MPPADSSGPVTAIAGGYYSTPEVGHAIGYPGQEARAVTPATTPDYIEEGLLDHVVGTG